MTIRRPRISGVTLLAAAVLVLLPALAWLQYSWLQQIADADRDRRERTLQTAASQLAQDLDSELGKAVMELQLEPSLVEQRAWSAYAQRYQLWADSALAPEIVKAIYFVEDLSDEPAQTEPALQVWDVQTQTFDNTTWPPELASVRTRFLHDSRGGFDVQITGPRRGERGGRVTSTQRMLLPPSAAGDEQSIVVPVIRLVPLQASTSAGVIPSGPPHVKLLGFTIIRLDLAALGTQLIPVLVRRHLANQDGRSDFFVGVVSRQDPSRVIFESEPGAAGTAVSAPDVTVSLLGPRVGPLLFMRDGRRPPRDSREPFEGKRPPPPPHAPPPDARENQVVVDVIESRRNEAGGMVQTRAFGGGDGHWRLVVKHRSGSLEAAVAAARTRNFVLSSGILLLLTTAIALIVVSARRADRLARQQLEFVAAVSHELRTPVSVIGAAAGNLADGVVEEPGRVKKYGATIQTEARRLGETVERVLQLAGMAAGRGPSMRTAISAADLVREAVNASQHEIEIAGATVEVEIAAELRNLPTDPAGVQRVIGDPTALRSAIQNLISNAIKYGGSTPWVKIRVRPTTQRATRITVQDRGLGIDAEDRKHIFEPFYRGREAVSRQIQGSGLGLHLVRRIIEAHGGTVSVQSEPGQGSTFIIELPGVHNVVVKRATTDHHLAFRPPATR